MATVTVGCKLPNGLILESGYTVDNGNVVRTPEYKRLKLNGANQSRFTIVQSLDGKSVRELANPKAPLHLEPGITENVDEAFFDKWVEDHKHSNIVRNKLVWKAKNKSEAKARAIGETQKDIGFEARDQTKLGGKLKAFNADDNVGFGNEIAGV
jgi:hypothetical protein